MPPLQVVFAPDWRAGVPYQALLGEALGKQGVQVSYLQHYRRVLPLARLLRGKAAAPWEILHLHWPEAYYPQKGDRWDRVRLARFPLDLWLATRGRALALTAHNLHAHNRAHDHLEHRNTRAAFARARVIFAHSPAAKERIVSTFGVSEQKVVVTPHGDLSVTLGSPHPQREARERLGIAHLGKVCLIFGAAEPYKGLEEAIAFWQEQAPAGVTLAIVGRPKTTSYGAELTRLASEAGAGVHLRLGWLSDEALRDWLSAADCALFNYREIFTSGAAQLARSYGLPQLIPQRLTTVLLDEPSPYVFRFDSFAGNFAAQLQAALQVAPSFAEAAPWRESHSWQHIAELTAAGYRQAMNR